MTTGNPSRPDRGNPAPPPDAPAADAAPGRFAYEGLHRVIHERARLSILTSLATHSRGLLFADLRELCSLTDGNLNRHLAVLEEHRLVEVSKSQINRRPQTLCRLTPLGRRRLEAYLEELERVLSDALAAGRAAAPQKSPPHGPGLEPDLGPA